MIAPSCIRLAAVLLLTALPARAGEFRLALPVDCTIGTDCVIQNYVDLDPGPGWRDYACGPLTYDGHKGTDFRIRDYQMMARGVAVRAAAAGTVLGVRNDQPDREPGRDYAAYLATVAGKECGNGVVLYHGDGVETQYCHLRAGSIGVQRGDRVAVGDFLGYIGLSGKTEFPHLHISVRRDGAVVGPFTGPCSEAGEYLWQDDLAYTGTHLLKYGFAAAPPDLDSIERGVAPALNPASPALLFWINVVGVRAGDEQRLSVRRPDGSTLVDHARTVKDSQVNWLAYAGKRRPPGGWPRGTYTAEVHLTRGSETVIRQEAAVEVQ